VKRTSTYGLTHIAVSVRDLDITRKFYTTVFGMKVMYHEKDFLQLTTPGCSDIIVFEKTRLKKVKSGRGIDHFGFRLRKPGDMDDISRRIRKAKGRIIDRGEFVPGSPYIFFKDPDGYKVEVWYEVLA